jgi:hypothetical protein
MGIFEKDEENIVICKKCECQARIKPDSADSQSASAKRINKTVLKRF